MLRFGADLVTPLMQHPALQQMLFMLSMHIDIDDEDLELIDGWIPESANYTHDAYDEFLGSLLFYVTQPDGDRLQGTVTKRLRSEDGTPIGK
jgi:hypothetical protein